MIDWSLEPGSWTARYLMEAIPPGVAHVVGTRLDLVLLVKSIRRVLKGGTMLSLGKLDKTDWAVIRYGTDSPGGDKTQVA